MTPLAATQAISALDALERVLRPPLGPEPRLGVWRWAVRQRMSGVRDLLLGETARPDAEWLAPRHRTALRERRTLLQRLSALGAAVLEAPDAETVRRDALRLVEDVRRHLQRRNDLAWDDVEQEFGGSE